MDIARRGLDILFSFFIFESGLINVLNLIYYAYHQAYMSRLLLVVSWYLICCRLHLASLLASPAVLSQTSSTRRAVAPERELHSGAWQQEVWGNASVLREYNPAHTIKIKCVLKDIRFEKSTCWYAFQCCRTTRTYSSSSKGETFSVFPVA